MPRLALPARYGGKRGQYATLEGLVNEAVKDKAYFAQDGGVTLSGGEALMQHRFAGQFMQALKREGIHTALDTAGLVSWDAFLDVLPHTDLILYDIKLMDSAQHKKHTGQGNERILSNLLNLKSILTDENPRRKLWIRTPVIPGATDSDDNIADIARFIHEKLHGAVERWELCAFNNLCQDKYEKLGMAWRFNDEQLLDKTKLERLKGIAAQNVRGSTKVFATGATKFE